MFNFLGKDLVNLEKPSGVIKELSANNADKNYLVSENMILIDMKVFYKNKERYDHFKNIGRVFRLPGIMRLGVYDKESGFFRDILIPLSEIDHCEMNFREIPQKLTKVKRVRKNAN